MKNNALIIGNTDGIGLKITKELLNRQWGVAGASRSKSSIEAPPYKHTVVGVQQDEYVEKLKSIMQNGEPIDLCMYCAGIGELLEITSIEKDITVFEVNLTGMVKTASVVIPMMVKRGKGHFMGLSSFADELLSKEAPSYHASKAGFSNYLEGLALALKPLGVYVTNVRFGFVDTKMAKGDVKPFMMSVEKAAFHLLQCIRKKPIRYTAPRIAIPLVKFRKLMMKLSIF